jgi:carbon-monoxide dehydrogenase medium subunit
MIMKFTYIKPKTVAEAVGLKEELGDKAKFLAGGTHLLLQLKRGKINPSYLISLNGLEELKSFGSNDAGITVGVLNSLRKIEKDPFFKEHLPVLAATAPVMATPQIRTLATVGGNICNASPAADMAPPLIALGANLKVVGTAGTRTFSLEDFYLGPGQNTLEGSEILTGLQIPKPRANSGTCYLKESIRRGHDIALVGVAVMIVTSDQDDSKVEDIRIVLGAVAPVPLRATAAEDLLRGNKIDEQLISEAARLTADISRPIDDLRATANYRKKLVSALATRGLRQLLRGGDR